MYQRIYLSVLIAIFLLSDSACTKAPPSVPTVARVDRVGASPVDTTQTVFQKTFSLKASATFPFEIPAHAAQPRLHGTFQSFVGQLGGESDDSANINFAILNEEQQNESTGGQPSDAVFSVEPSHSQAVNVDLPPSLNQPVKYYLVFTNSAKTSSSGKVVEANFRVDF